MSHKILVPVDFSPITEISLEYALGAAKALNTGITLLHLVHNNDAKIEAEDKLNDLIYKYNSVGVNIRGLVRSGNIFDGIGQTSKDLKASLIFLGTHGIRGLQYVFGSHALKVVTHAETPFIITQDRLPKNDHINNIVVPIDLGVEEKQILTAVIQAARAFQATVHFFVSHHSDEFTAHAVNRNLAFAKRYLAEHNVEHTTTHATESGEFDEQTIRFANAQDADLIAIVNHKEDGFKNLFGTNFDQNIITNKAKIPVLILNTKSFSSIDDFFGVFV